VGTFLFDVQKFHDNPKDEQALQQIRQWVNATGIFNSCSILTSSSQGKKICSEEYDNRR
jgi:hypothetical protein